MSLGSRVARRDHTAGVGESFEVLAPAGVVDLLDADLQEVTSQLGHNHLGEAPDGALPPTDAATETGAEGPTLQPREIDPRVVQERLVERLVVEDAARQFGLEEHVRLGEGGERLGHDGGSRAAQGPYVDERPRPMVVRRHDRRG
jgi:hypothetical protein